MSRPIFELLPDSAHWPDIIEAVDNTYHAQGVGQAMVRFAAAMGMNDAGHRRLAGGSLDPRRHRGR